MKRDTWIISDTHFQDAAMLGYLGSDGEPFRKFDNQRECDELMIDNWNANIKPHDSVWHLGDVFSGDKDSFCDIWARLNGRKRLIVGNHDDIRYLSGKNPRTGSYFFQKIDVWRVFREHNIILTHIPMELSNSYEGRTADFNVHGHIHSNPSPTVRHYNACVEPNGFAPIHLEELSSRLNKRKSSI